MLFDAMNLGLALLAVVIAIPSGLLAWRDLRSARRDDTARGYEGIGSSTVWIPPRDSSPTLRRFDDQPLGNTTRSSQHLAPTTEWIAPLGLWRRFFAWYLNVLTVYAPIVLGVVVGDTIDPAVDGSTELTAGQAASYSAGTLVALVVVVWNVRQAAINGRSIGLHAVGGAALDERTGIPIGYLRVLKRTAWVIFSAVYVGLVVPLSAFLRRDRRTWTDRWAGAVVVRFSRRESPHDARPIVDIALPTPADEIDLTSSTLAPPPLPDRRLADHPARPVDPH